MPTSKTGLIYILFILITLPVSLIAQMVSIEDFRIPETKYQRLMGGLSGGWNKSDQESMYTLYNYSYINYKNSNSSNSSNGQISLDYITNNFNEDYSFQLSLSASGITSKSNSTSNQLNPDHASSSSSSQSNSNGLFRPGVNYSKYIVPDKWYGYVEGNGIYSYQENKQTSQGTDYYNWAYSKSNDWSASTGMGFGYGKMRDGYSIFGVLRIIDKLQEDSLLVRSLTKEEIVRLASIFARRDEYAYSQERYVKYFMDDLFRELQTMGVLKNNVPLTYSVARAIEVLSENIEPRLFGWRVQVGFLKTFDENKEYSNNDYDRTSYFWNSRNFVRLSSEYGHALSLNLHLYSKLSVDIPNVDYNRKIDFNFNVKGIYQIGERIDASIWYILTRNHTVNEFDQDVFNRNLQSEISASFRFFIENNVSFTLSAGYLNYEQYGFTPYGITSETHNSPHISFGVDYRFF